MHNQTDTNILIGDLLRAAGAINLKDLTEAIQVSGMLGLPVGRVLIMMGVLSNDTLKHAIKAQSLIRDRLLPLDVAVTALRNAVIQRTTLDTALERVGWLPPADAQTNRLGELLVEAGILSIKLRDDSVGLSQLMCLPLGRILVVQGLVSQTMVDAALSAQQLIRDGRIERSEAIKALSSAYRQKRTLEESLSEQGCLRPLPQPRLRLGELLVLSGLVKEKDLYRCLEIGNMTKQPIGQVLVKLLVISETELEAALRLQKMVNRGDFTPTLAAIALQTIHNTHGSFSDIVVQLNKKAAPQKQDITTIELLKLAGLVTQSDIVKAFKNKEELEPIEQALIRIRVIKDSTLQTVGRCKKMIDDGLLRPEQAIVALHRWQWSGISLSSILDELGWTSGKPLSERPTREMPTLR